MSREAPPITDEMLTKRITQVLQATLPSMLAIVVAARTEHQTSPPRVEKTNNNILTGRKIGCRTCECLHATTFRYVALLWWNLVELVMGEAAIATMTWEQMEKLTTDKYFSRVELNVELECWLFLF
ncbi:hypothetical protein OSB04_007869 [Centaurea solstitialis]|uniref:Uncharacterized protein n=1 Tax=Centaurea solstitialis TaxID=347529 RepID=A0AA38TKP9_9ASTR|nr:hypothetical protein OSB04_007869 [Centaurea solstitialis]